jgi:hypothetical protein
MRIRSLFLVAALFVAGFINPAFSQQGLRQVQLGYCVLSSMTAATALSSCTTTLTGGGTQSGVPTGTTYLVICAYVQNVNWLDNQATPTGTAGTGGQQIASGQCLPYNANYNFLLFIQQTSGAILGISFYR